MGKMLEQLFTQNISLAPSEKLSPGQKYHLDFPEGKGTFAVYPVFPGAELLINEYKGAFLNHKHSPYQNVMQINYCLNGRMGWNLQNGDCIYLSTGDISIHMMNRCASSVMYFPSEYYLGISISLDFDAFDPPDTLKNMGFDLWTLKEKFCPQERTTVLPATEHLKTFFSMLDTIPEPCQLCYFQIKLQELLLFLFTHDTTDLCAEKCSLENIQTIHQVHKKLISNLKERPTIESLAKDFLINTSTLKKVFKAVYGQPIAQYMKDYRMHYAANLLCKTEQSVKEISEQVGYGNPSKFANAFREVMQITPLEYRSRYKMKNLM